jgi:hypothetical protein
LGKRDDCAAAWKRTLVDWSEPASIRAKMLA